MMRIYRIAEKGEPQARPTLPHAPSVRQMGRSRWVTQATRKAARFGR